jgi:hypothetical protein
VLSGGLGSLQAQVPAEDARNAYVPNTDTHFTMPVYRTLAEWEARKAHLRKQILRSHSRSQSGPARLSAPVNNVTIADQQLFARADTMQAGAELILEFRDVHGLHMAIMAMLMSD